jgi:hypothetical protein
MNTSFFTNSTEDLVEDNITKYHKMYLGAGCMAQAVEQLPNKHKALITTPPKKKKKDIWQDTLFCFTFVWRLM